MATSTNACNTNERSDNLNRLPWLANPLLRFDLSKELQELRSKGSWDRETGRSAKTLAKHPDFRIVLVHMKANTQMNQHRAEGRVSIHQLLGKMCVRVPEQEVNLSAGELLVLDGGVLHDLEALEESCFLLTISWRADRLSASEFAEASVERRVDEEAELRLEDEGAPAREESD